MSRRLSIPILATLLILGPCAAWLTQGPARAAELPLGVRAFRMTMELPGGGRGSGRGSSWGWGDSAFDRVRGSVWLSNDLNETVTEVKMVIHFSNLRFSRESGTCTYPIGTLGPHQSLAMNYRWDDWDGDRVAPWIEITYRQPGQEGLQRTVFRPSRY